MNRETARKNGSKLYIGSPCKNRHLISDVGVNGSVRYTSSAECVKCKESRSLTKHLGFEFTIEQKEVLIESQNGKCANPNCDVIFANENPIDIHLDHDHETGTIRGVLCRVCNFIEGYYTKHPERFAGILKYLEKSS